jgi:hypothetical protein
MQHPMVRTSWESLQRRENLVSRTSKRLLALLRRAKLQHSRAVVSNELVLYVLFFFYFFFLFFVAGRQGGGMIPYDVVRTFALMMAVSAQSMGHASRNSFILGAEFGSCIPESLQ